MSDQILPKHMQQKFISKLLNSIMRSKDATKI